METSCRGEGEEEDLEGVGGEMEEGSGGETWTGIGEKRKQLIGAVRERGAEENGV
jgi:hypothetical protein